MGPMPCGDQLFETDPAEPVPPRARGAVPVDKTFRVYDQDQSFLMPPSLRDWLPTDYLAHFVSELVDGVLDLPRSSPPTPRSAAFRLITPG